MISEIPRILPEKKPQEKIVLKDTEEFIKKRLQEIAIEIKNVENVEDENERNIKIAELQEEIVLLKEELKEEENDGLDVKTEELEEITNVANGFEGMSPSKFNELSEQEKEQLAVKKKESGLAEEDTGESRSDLNQFYNDEKGVKEQALEVGESEAEDVKPVQSNESKKNEQIEKKLELREAALNDARLEFVKQDISKNSSKSDSSEALRELGVAKENYKKAKEEMLNAMIEKGEDQAKALSATLDYEEFEKLRDVIKEEDREGDIVKLIMELENETGGVEEKITLENESKKNEKIKMLKKETDETWNEITEVLAMEAGDEKESRLEELRNKSAELKKRKEELEEDSKKEQESKEERIEPKVEENKAGDAEKELKDKSIENKEENEKEITLESLESERKALNGSIKELKEKIEKAKDEKNYEKIEEFEAEAEELKKRTDKYKEDKKKLNGVDKKEEENKNKLDKLLDEVNQLDSDLSLKVEDDKKEQEPKLEEIKTEEKTNEKRIDELSEKLDNLDKYTESEEDKKKRKEIENQEQIEKDLEAYETSLNNARLEYARQDISLKNSFKNLGMALSLSENDFGEASGELGEAKKIYEEAQKNMLKAIIEKKYKEQVTEEQADALIKQFKVGEFAKLDMAKVKVKGERWGGGGKKWEEAKKGIGDGIEKYRNMPLKKKLVFIGAGVGLTFATGTLGATGVAGSVAFGMRGLGFASMYKGFRKEKEVVDRYEEKQDAVANKTSLEVRRGMDEQNENASAEEKARKRAKLLFKVLDKEIDNTHKQLQQKNYENMEDRRNAVLKSAALIMAVQTTLASVVEARGVPIGSEGLVLGSVKGKESNPVKKTITKTSMSELKEGLDQAQLDNVLEINKKVWKFLEAGGKFKEYTPAQIDVLRIDDLDSEQKAVYDDLKYEIGRIVKHDPRDYNAETINEFFTAATKDVMLNHPNKMENFKKLFEIKKG